MIMVFVVVVVVVDDLSRLQSFRSFLQVHHFCLLSNILLQIGKEHVLQVSSIQKDGGKILEDIP